MFRQITALIFMMAFVIQTFSAPFIMLDYYANTSIYAKKCVYKEKPKMHCNGKCQVMKKMREEEKKEKQDQERKPTFKTQTISSKSFFCTVVIDLLNLEKSYLKENSYLPSSPSKDFFHPPQCRFSI